ncbi:MAG: transketolase [Minisyncoccia bacterium]
MVELTNAKIKFLELQANKLRQAVIEMLMHAGSGHVAGPLGMADIFSALYFYVLNHSPQNPHWEDRDRLVVSNGHICPVQYAALAYAGYFPLNELLTLRKINSRLQGHPHRNSLPGIETTSGPLGSGLSQAIGIALSAKLNNKKYFVYCIVSDGEHQEGNFWEAVMFAGKQKFNLNNLILIVDRNNIQIDGFTEEVMPLEPLIAKYESFGWHTIEIDGHNIQQFIDAVNEAKAIFEKPSVIIAHTIPGKGVDFMEYDYKWHGTVPNKEQAKKALQELRTLQNKIKLD